MKTASLERVTVQLRQLASRGAGQTQTDRQLVDRFLARGEEAAFAELVRRHGPMVLGVCRRILHHQQDAEDTFQAAFLILARKARTVRDAESVAGWLFQVAFRLALRARCRGNRHEEHLTAMHELPSQDQTVQERETQALVDEALAQLPDHYRAAIVLCCLEGKSQSAAAQLLGTTTGAINSRVKRGRQLLRASLTRRGLVLSAAGLATALAARRASAAGLPIELLSRTTHAAVEFAAGGASAGATPEAIILAQGALRTMWNHPLKLLTGLLVALGFLFAAAWLPGAFVGGDPVPSPVPRAATVLPPALEPGQAGGGKEKPAKMHCIILWMSGGPSQFETWDPKPAHANGGPGKVIDTSVKGIQISENLPNLAKLADYLAIIRSLSHNEGDHARGHYLMHTGYNHDNQTKYPSLGAVLGRELGGDKIAVPRFVVVGPKAFGTVDDGAGYLGPKYGPLHVGPPDGGFRPAELDKDAEMRVPPLEAFEVFDKDNAEAMRKAVTKAVDRMEEKKALRDAYGNNSFGQSCLVARRLIEQGVPVVEVTLPGWDTHADNFTAVEKLSKKLDAGFATLLKDLREHRLLDKTLIVWMGEFGRTPIINMANGRDHYPKAFSVVLAGAKIKGGQVHGTTSPDGVQVVNEIVSVAQLYATIYTAVGVDPALQYMSNTGAPVRLVPDGFKAIPELLR
jgi:RNA polymerase sigma factor (sigma-70 family)